MLNYIATESTAKIIQEICKEKNIMVLYEREDIVDINKYLKETKANFNLIKYFVIEIDCLENSKDDIFENINNFSKIHTDIRIIILAKGMKEQDKLLNKLYSIGIYNIINSAHELEFKENLIKALSDKGIQKNEARRFEKIEEIKKDNSFIRKIKNILIYKKIKLRKIIKEFNIERTNIHKVSCAYFLALISETINMILKSLSYIIGFILIITGVIALLNNPVRNLLFQVIGLK